MRLKQKYYLCFKHKNKLKRANILISSNKATDLFLNPHRQSNSNSRDFNFVTLSSPRFLF